MQAFGSWRILLLNTDDLGNADDVLTRVGANGVEFKPGGGGAAWGGITGTLSAQTDLQAAIDAVTFDQALNTTDDVVFGSVTTNAIDASPAFDFDMRMKSLRVLLDPPRFTLNVGDGGSLAAGQYTLAISYFEGGEETAAITYAPQTVTLNQKITLSPTGETGIGGGVTTGVFRVYVGVDGSPDQYVDIAISGGEPFELTTLAGSTPGTPPSVGNYSLFSVTSGDVALNPAGDLYLSPNGALNINGTPGVTAGPFTTITSITVTKGIITALTGT